MRGKKLITIIGCGEVGYIYAQAIYDAGYSLQLCTPRPSEKIIKFSSEKNILLHNQAQKWLNYAEIVILTTPGSVALNVAKEVIPFLKKETVLADFSSSSPDNKREAALIAASQQIFFADVVIMGSVELNRAHTPLLCSGTGTEKIVGLMQKLGAKVRTLPNAAAGDAASLKLLRSIFMKGLSALTVECMIAAQYYGVKELLYEVMSDLDQTPLNEFLDMLLRNHVIHACRQRHEVVEARKQLESSGLPIQLLPAIEELFTKTCERIKVDPIANKNPTTEEALTWLVRSKAGGVKSGQGTG